MHNNFDFFFGYQYDTNCLFKNKCYLKTKEHHIINNVVNNVVNNLKINVKN